MPIEEFDLGGHVECDDCGVVYTDRPDVGGILFQSKAICPACAPSWQKQAKKYDEEHYIRAICPEGMPFAQWVREVVRGGKPAIMRIYSGDDAVKRAGCKPDA